MTAKAYLEQANYLDDTIASHLREISRIRSTYRALPSCEPRERVQTSRDPDPPFVNAVIKVLDLEAKINAEIDRLVDLKEQIRETIDAVPDTREQLVLRKWYLEGRNPKTAPREIAREMGVNEKTIRRWHARGLSKVILPEFPITI